jgi:hypothetical protein
VEYATANRVLVSEKAEWIATIRAVKQEIRRTAKMKTDRSNVSS